MSRPEVYKHLADNHIRGDRYLASTGLLYGLIYQGEWLIQVKPQQYEYQPIRKYYRHIYSSIGQARQAQHRIAEEYGIEAQIVELTTNDLQVD